MGRVVDLTGQKFGNLTAIQRCESREEGQAYRWVCRCDCGTVRDYNYGSLTTGKSTSCGRACPTKIHPLRNSPTETSWRKMLSRCHGKNKEEWYSDVIVCDRWLPSKGGSFENFVEDMGERPEGMTLNRIHGAKIYSKSTCEWADASFQSFDQDVRKYEGHVPGVKYRRDRSKWVSEISKNGKIHNLYYGDSKEDAINARLKAEIELFGRSKIKEDI